MRAVGVREFGGPEALEIVEVPERHAGTGEVRIKVAAAAVNPTDTIHRCGRRAEMLAVDPPPYVPGMDVAGVIDEVGDGVTRFAVGDEVMGIVIPRGDHGGYRESIVLPHGSVSTIPRGANLIEACTLPMNGLTARLALDLLALTPGSTLAVTGAAGAFGGYAVQLARADGLAVIADASASDEALVASLGADHVVTRGPEVAARIREIFPDGVDGLADGSVQNEQILDAVRDGGVIASVRGWAGSMERSVEVRPTWVRDYVESWERLEALRDLVEVGGLTLRVAGVYPAEQAAETHRLLEAGGARGRFVITF